MTVKLLTEQHLEFLSFEEARQARLSLHCLVKIPHCWKSHATAHNNKYEKDNLDWLQSLKHFFINVSYHILVASLTLMALLTEPSVRLATSI